MPYLLAPFRSVAVTLAHSEVVLALLGGVNRGGYIFPRTLVFQSLPLFALLLKSPFVFDVICFTRRV